ncbi:nucleoside/nucleotide kinase family protein [Mesorhizobium australicum]|uniref:Phosphoribulokinase / Uridine kinase family protein n=1 Tax=Mesorhizobium australicum TaxID=536018 RepID=A0A1X7MYQ5_9HYPH|nr:nucleoside/nucleotide kinase family protein [Mesorhizobium australicum]SMH29426.1 Phosphoribulokinase / Uridine kinase family protein [Mesorhizobium australicum]
MDEDGLLAAIAERVNERERLIVGIAGAPGSGKSTLAERLRQQIEASGESVAVVPMDGFHFDDRVLSARGLLPRKGAPETFDVAGFRHLLMRRARETEVAIPVFDRSIEISRAGAAVVQAETRILLVEGNYLLLDETPWNGLAGAFDMTVWLDVPVDELERRLVQRWLDHGFSTDAAREKALSNDIPNARRTAARSRAADVTL